jgi:hypothetical protein
MYCKFLKLINGDNIIVTTDDDCLTFKGKEFLNCVDPVQVSTVRYPRGSMVIETYVLQPWIKMSMDEAIQIPVSSIVVAVNVQELAFKQYKRYVEEFADMDEEFQQSLDFEDEEEEFDEFLNAVLGSDNEEEEDDRIGRAERTLH